LKTGFSHYLSKKLFKTPVARKMEEQKKEESRPLRENKTKKTNKNWLEMQL
jgi:hypothetical protein